MSYISQSAVRKEEQEISVLGTAHDHVNLGDVLDSVLWYMSVLIFTIHMYFIHPLFISYIIPNHQMHILCIHAC